MCYGWAATTRIRSADELRPVGAESSARIISPRMTKRIMNRFPAGWSSFRRSEGEVMKILLVNPEFPDTYWSFRHALAIEGKRSAFPPLGLLTVSALLPPSWERRLVDLNVRSLKSSDIDWADMVFATAMLVQKDSLRSVVKRCKDRRKRVVLGGP